MVDDDEGDVVETDDDNDAVETEVGTNPELDDGSFSLLDLLEIVKPRWWGETEVTGCSPEAAAAAAAATAFDKENCPDGTGVDCPCEE